MSSNLNIVHTPTNTGVDSLRVNKTAQKINGLVSLLRFKDKDTHQFVAYCPSLEVSGYGETADKAIEMLKFSIQDFFDYLIDLPVKQIENELRDLGFKHSKIRNKEYSRAYVDNEGELKNFNAVDDKVERLTLEAA